MLIPRALHRKVPRWTSPKAAADLLFEFWSSEVDLYLEAYKISPTKEGLRDSDTKLKSVQK
jgi:hypothetical protein